MKYIYGVLIFFFLINSSLFSQENSKRNIIDKDQENYENDVFKKEFGEVEEDSTDVARKLYDRIPEKIPDWVFSTFEIENSTRIVSYSDPNMDQTAAIAQAILRAKAMYAIMNYNTVEKFQ